ncbi:hypothetical protein SAMN02745123_00605 [Desulforamulus aeronauticus DSM 10349]|uniref:Uncharacterized protein n=1 Tax=Desulforamulus aeronauticus DSM 10349 TaxID=1121421 RepID=A0A1M6PIL2_9FIRM|nr:hypothetical protein SAMN02745123_00605 [Desulforamulus aeronauticus DSM 10349]
MKYKNYYMFFIVSLVIFVTYTFQKFLVLWIGFERFSASDFSPGDILINEKLKLLILYPAIFTILLYIAIITLNILARRLIHVKVSQNVSIAIIFIALIFLELRLIFALF